MQAMRWAVGVLITSALAGPLHAAENNSLNLIPVPKHVVRLDGTTSIPEISGILVRDRQLLAISGGWINRFRTVQKSSA